jgi:serine O-acetyltransferase
MIKTIRQDIQTVFDRDPAARSMLEVLFCYPGLHALWFYRLSHWLWTRKLFLLGRWLSYFSRFLTGIEIHPGARIGPGLFIDHGLGTVIGETAEIGEGVTLYHNVTLGGVSLKKEKRHPTVEDHVVIGAGAQVLGPIRVGAHSRIGANSVVVKDVLNDSVVVGIPGRVSSRNGVKFVKSDELDLQHNVLPDAVMERLLELNMRLAQLEHEVTTLRKEAKLNSQSNHNGQANYNGERVPEFFD